MSCRFHGSCSGCYCNAQPPLPPGFGYALAALLILAALAVRALSRP